MSSPAPEWTPHPRVIRRLGRPLGSGQDRRDLPGRRQHRCRRDERGPGGSHHRLARPQDTPVRRRLRAPKRAARWGSAEGLGTHTRLPTLRRRRSARLPGSSDPRSRSRAGLLTAKHRRLHLQGFCPRDSPADLCRIRGFHRLVRNHTSDELADSPERSLLPRVARRLGRPRGARQDRGDLRGRREERRRRNERRQGDPDHRLARSTSGPVRRRLRAEERRDKRDAAFSCLGAVARVCTLCGRQS